MGEGHEQVDDQSDAANQANQILDTNHQVLLSESIERW
jgi:hypothetical protein